MTLDLTDIARRSALPGANVFARYLAECERRMHELNPLSRLVMMADMQSVAWAHGTAGKPRVELGSLITAPGETWFLHPDQTPPPARSIEAGGVHGAIEWVRKQPGLELVFANDMAYTRLGLDLVVRDRSRGSFIVIEAKGTTLPFQSTVAYLKDTKRKGRQLSWRWCWHSLCQFALSGPTARLFLDLWRPCLQGRLHRMVLVTRLRSRRKCFLPVETRAIDAIHVRNHAWLHDQHALNRPREFAKETNSRRFARTKSFVAPVHDLGVLAYSELDPNFLEIPKFKMEGWVEALIRP